MSCSSAAVPVTTEQPLFKAPETEKVGQAHFHRSAPHFLYKYVCLSQYSKTGRATATGTNTPAASPGGVARQRGLPGYSDVAIL